MVGHRALDDGVSEEVLGEVDVVCCGPLAEAEPHRAVFRQVVSTEAIVYGDLVFFASEQFLRNDAGPLKMQFPPFCVVACCVFAVEHKVAEFHLCAANLRLPGLLEQVNV